MKKNNNDDSFFGSFKYKYNNVEGYDSFIKLLVFLVISIIIIVFAKVAIAQDKAEEQKNQVTTNESNNNNSLKKLLDTLIKKEATIKITNGDYVAVIKNVKESNEEITGLFQDSKKQLKEFKISDQKVYELELDEEVENDKLFENINLDFVIPSMLVSILEDNKTIKSTNGDNALYTYEYLDNEITYNITLSVVLNKVELISIKNDEITYEITYK